MRRPVLVVALCLLVTLAGCSFGGTPTATAPGGSTDLTAANAPPGVSAETGALVDATALLDAHTAALNESGFVLDVRSNATVVRDGEPQRVRRQQVVRAQSGGATYNTTVVNPGSRFDIWGNRSVQVARVQSGDTVRYTEPSEPRSVAQLSGRALLAGYLTTDDWTVTEVEDEGNETFITLRSSTVPAADGTLPSDASDVRGYAAVMIVDTKGRVRFFEATADYTIDAQDGSFTVRHQVVSLAEPDVVRPDWLDEAFTSS